MIIKMQNSKPAAYSISYLCDGKHFREIFPIGTKEDAVFTKAAHLVCFSDCTDVRLVRVHHQGREYRYSGWQPRMKIEFENENGVSEWYGYFPEWDH